MARFIDADALIKRMKDGKYVDRETSFQRGVNSAIDYWITEINHFPSADVVPKSEVEYMTKEEIVQIIGEADKYCKNTSCTKCKFNEIKTPYCWWYNIAEHIYTAQNTNNFDSRQTIEEKKHTKTQSILGEWKFDEKLHTEQPDLSNVKFIDKDGNITNRDDALDWNEAPPLEESEDK